MPSENLERNAFVLLQRVAGHLLREVEEVLKPSHLSPSQYNVLRILRGGDPEGIPCRTIAERMITRDPDMTRLLDRLEGRGLVTRTRLSSDRRVVRTRISDAGLVLLEGLDRPINDLHIRQLSHVGQDNLEKLSELLTIAQKSRETV